LADLVSTNPRKAKKTAAKQAIRVTKQQAAEAAVRRLLDLAQGELDLPSTLQVNIKNDFHTSEEPISHATFSFSSETICGTSTKGDHDCNGHAFEATNPLPGEIFAACRSRIFVSPSTIDKLPVAYDSLFS